MTDPLPPYPGPSGRGDRPASLARRVVPAVVILGAAGGLLVALDHPHGSAEAATGTDAANDQTAPLQLDPSGTATTAAPSTATTAAPSASTPRSTTTTVPAAPSCTSAVTTVTGSAVSTRYGPVQVSAEVDASGTLCSIEAIRTPDGDRRSLSINQRAVPTLTERALAAGGTDFNGVSGATITSNAYKRSLQSILDQQ